MFWLAAGARVVEHSLGKTEVTSASLVGGSIKMEEAPKTEEQLVDELRTIRTKFWEDVLGYVKCATFSRMLMSKYPDYQRYKLFHILNGSTPPEYVDKFDFPGEDSIETFIRSL